MKLSDGDDFDAIRDNWRHYVEIVGRIEKAQSQNRDPAVMFDDLPLNYPGDDGLDEAESSQLLASARVFAIRRLRELIEEFRSIDVEVDWDSGLPDSAIEELFGTDALQAWNRKYGKP